jgi:hypothetical protein
MITFLVAGRNDGYGINLHKRTAISLNFLASLCQDDNDEIVYVDCNTHAQDCTLAEAIADTLTPEARRRLRIFRVSGEQMLAAIGETPLPFSDELSRNVGIRRSNPKNPWLLSTNCDILIQPLGNRSLADLLKTLPRRFYLCPRIGVPAAQWQMLDRVNIQQMCEFCDGVLAQGARLPAEREQPWLRFHSVGDFQLAPREQWFQIAGCEEGMKFWGHSDANNAKRLNLLNGGGRTPDLSDQLRVLHLDHNFTAGNAHQNILIHNDWKRWIDDVTAPDSHNGKDWGLAGLDLPEIRLPDLAATDAQLILKTHRRQRNFWAQMKLRLAAQFWKRAGGAANWLEKRSNTKSDANNADPK